MITIKQVRDALHYDYKTGEIRWKNPPHERIKFASLAGCFNHHGYLRIRLFGEQFQAHRIAWALYYGKWPNNDLDHIDGNRGNNKIRNLRLASKSINSQNLRKPLRNNHSGFLGVVPSGRKWMAKIRLPNGGKQMVIGRYITAQEAHEAYRRVKRRLHDGCTI